MLVSSAMSEGGGVTSAIGRPRLVKLVNNVDPPTQQVA